MNQLAVVVAGAVAGAAVGWGLRPLLAAIPRGAELSYRALVPAGAVVTALGAGLTASSPRIGLTVWVGLLLVALGGIDLACHRLPDALTLPAIPITAAIAALTQWLAPGSGSLLRGMLVGGLLFLLFGALSLISRRAMGLGDVKLVGSLGIAAGYLSVAAALLAVVAAFVLGAAVAILGLLTGRMSMGSRFAFGPYLILGCWVVLLFPSLAAP